MKKICFLLPAVSIALLFSCKKKKDDTSAGGGSQAITILKNSGWRVAGAQTLTVKQGAAGGGFNTVAFNIQKPGELRWYTWFRDASSYSKQNEIVLNTQGAVTINKDLKAPAYGGEIKGFEGADTWKVNRSFDRADVIYLFRNDQPFANTTDPQYPNIERIQAVEDGILNSSNGMNSNAVAHFSYATQKWRKNGFSGNNFVAVRHNGLTYVTTFSVGTADNTIRILMESATPATGTGNQPMTTVKTIPNVNSGSLLHVAKYNDNVFAVFENYQSSNKYAVYKINLTNLTVDLVQSPTAFKGFGLPVSGILYNWALIEVDDSGNLYVVENRVENQKSNYSIRKYTTGGGSEEILKEEHLLQYTAIQALKFFGGKLHAAVVYKEDVPDGNPNDFSFTYNYQMQIISPK